MSYLIDLVTLKESSSSLITQGTERSAAKENSYYILLVLLELLLTYFLLKDAFPEGAKLYGMTKVFIIFIDTL